MAIKNGLCASYVAEALRGLHGEDDIYKIALYAPGASISSETTSYTGRGEVSGLGYTAGGMALEGFTVRAHRGVVTVDFNDAVWPVATLRAAGALVYNSSSGNRAVCVMDFGQEVASTNGPFKVIMPASGPDTSLIAIEF